MEQNRVPAESVSDVPDNVVELADHRPPEHTTEHRSERLRGQLAAEAGIATAEFAIVTLMATSMATLHDLAPAPNVDIYWT